MAKEYIYLWPETIFNSLIELQPQLYVNKLACDYSRLSSKRVFSSVSIFIADSLSYSIQRSEGTLRMFIKRPVLWSSYPNREYYFWGLDFYFANHNSQCTFCWKDIRFLNLLTWFDSRTFFECNYMKLPLSYKSTMLIYWFMAFETLHELYERNF